VRELKGLRKKGVRKIVIGKPKRLKSNSEINVGGKKKKRRLKKRQIKALGGF